MEHGKHKKEMKKMGMGMGKMGMEMMGDQFGNKRMKVNMKLTSKKSKGKKKK